MQITNFIKFVYDEGFLMKINLQKPLINSSKNKNLSKYCWGTEYKKKFKLLHQ